MSRITTYTCDKCKKTVKESGDLWPIKVVFGEFCSEAHKVDWCRDCCADMGLVEPIKEERRPFPAPTLEDIIREIAYEEASEVISNSHILRRK
jgi:hypothetical protein